MNKIKRYHYKTDSLIYNRKNRKNINIYIRQDLEIFKNVQSDSSKVITRRKVVN